MAPDLKAEAEALAGYHDEVCEIMLARAMKEETPAACDCSRGKRVVAILARLQVDMETQEQWEQSWNKVVTQRDQARADARASRNCSRHAKQLSEERVAREAQAEARGKREGIEAAAKVAEDACPCTCDVAYTSRKLVAPDCFKHQACDEAAAQIRALLPVPEKAGETPAKPVPIFSGPYSAKMWDEINDGQPRRALYLVCCRLQELETRIEHLEDRANERG